MLIRRLSLVGKPPKEAQLDTVTSVIYSIRGKGVKAFFRCFLYYQNPTVKLDTERFGDMMKALTRTLEESIVNLPVNAFASIVLLSLPGVTSDLIDNAKRVVKENSHGRIAYDLRLDVLGFDTASWRFAISPGLQ